MREHSVQVASLDMTCGPLRLRHGHLYRAGLILCLSASLTAPAAAATLPAGFSESLIASGLSNPTAMAFAPDGRLFVCEQGGQVRVIKNSVLLPTPFATLVVNSASERGLLGIAFDPAFATNQFIYIYYTATTPAIHNRVSRLTANGDVMLGGSEQIILDLPNLDGATNHNGGAIHFGIDGKLYVAVGDRTQGGNSQDLANPFGKILRINKENGSVPSDNPFVGVAGSYGAIWALGLRNPFTFDFHRLTGRMFINDVGQSAWEEVNDGIRGANYGWPSTEGPTSNPSFTAPLHAYPHDPLTGDCAITGGAFYDPPTSQFPALYSDAYFFADFCGGWIDRLDPSTGVAADFATGLSAPVDLKVAADGSLYYLARGGSSNTGVVRRIVFNAGSASAPAEIISPAAGSTLTTTTQTFTWNTGVNVSAFWLDVGRTQGGYEIFQGYVGTSQSRTISNIPLYGGPLWVRLRSFINGSYQIRDHQFFTSTVTPSRIVSPSAGSVLPGSTATFSWDAGAGVDFYWVSIGSTPGGYEFFSNFVGTSRALTVTNLPIDGRAIWVRLHSFIQGQYQFVDHRFVAAVPGVAQLLTPPAGSILSGAAETFTWSPGVGVSFYWVNVGSFQGGYDIFSNFVGGSRALTIATLPIDGRAIWVRLMSFIGGSYQFVDYRYTAATPGPAAILTPAAGSTLAGATQPFTWSPGVGATAYWVNVGSTQGGYEYYSNFVGASRMLTVSGLPIDGRDIWVRLMSLINGSYQFVDYRFTAARPTPSRITSPAPGSTLLSASQVFTWDAGVGVPGYWLAVGSQPGGYEFFDNYVGTDHSWRVNGLPLDGRDVWVRLWSFVVDHWEFVDHRFVAFQ
jgi:glucose/arabinose dehydrogenase